MVTKLFRSLGIAFVFHDRPYRLGESVSLVVELKPRRDLDVRQARVDLMCEERYTEITTVMRQIRPDPRLGANAPPPPSIPKQVTQRRKESYAHSSVTFLTNKSLTKGREMLYPAPLEIQMESPPHALEATLRWSLVAVIDVARGRDIAKSQNIDVRLVF